MAFAIAVNAFLEYYCSDASIVYDSERDTTKFSFEQVFPQNDMTLEIKKCSIQYNSH